MDLFIYKCNVYILLCRDNVEIILGYIMSKQISQSVSWTNTMKCCIFMHNYPLGEGFGTLNSNMHEYDKPEKVD